MRKCFSLRRYDPDQVMRVERKTLLSACSAGSPLSPRITTIPQSHRVSSANALDGATPPLVPSLADWRQTP